MLNNFQQFISSVNKTKIYLILANFLLVVVLMTLSNLKVIPLRTGDFTFFAILTLALALYRPGWAFLLFIGTIALENINLAPNIIGITVRPFQLLGALILLAVAIRFFSKKLYFNLPKLEWHDYALLVVVFSGFLGIINASDKITSFKLAIIFATFFILYYLVRVYVQNSEDLKRIVHFFVSSGVVIIFYGIWQNWRFMHNLASFETMPGRPNASFAEPDWLGIFLVLLISVVYTLIYHFQLNNSEKISNKIQNPNIQIADHKLLIVRLSLYFILSTLYILLILTVSRSAWLGALAATFVFLWIILTNLRFKDWQWKEVIRIKLGIITSLIISLAVVYIFHLTNFQLFNRVQSTGTGLQKITISCMNLDVINRIATIDNISELEKYGCQHINLEDIESEKAQGKYVTEIYRNDPNVHIRSEIYKKSWEQIKNHPILGIGWGSINSVLGKDERGAGLNSSNIFLEVYLGCGIIGFLSFAVFWFYIIFNAVRNFYFSEDVSQKSIFLFILAAWFGLTVANLFNAGIFLGFLWAYMGIATIKKT